MSYVGAIAVGLLLVIIMNLEYHCISLSNGSHLYDRWEISGMYKYLVHSKLLRQKPANYPNGLNRLWLLYFLADFFRFLK